MEGCDYTVAVAGGGAVRCKPEPATNRRGAVQSATLKVKLCKYVIRRSFSQVAHQQGLTNRPIVGTGREVIKKKFFFDEQCTRKGALRGEKNYGDLTVPA